MLTYFDPLSRWRVGVLASSRQWRLVGVLAGVVALGATAACGGGNGAQWRSPGGGAVETTPAAPPMELVLSHTANATNVSPADPVSIRISNGALDTVTLSNPEGKVVKGEFDAAKQSWLSTEALGYDKTYTLVIAGTGEDGRRHEETRTFATVKPTNFTLPYLRANVGNLLDGGTFGVGQPIVVWFDENIKDRAAAERTLAVTTDPPVLGAWRWMDNREVHWRPKAYWPAGTNVTVEAKVYGKDLGEGLYGQEDRKATFKIGQSKIAIADHDAKRMKVYVGGQQVTTINGKDATAGIPISMGKTGGERAPGGAWIDFRTNSGPHVITTKHEVYRMTSASYGLTDPNSPNFYDTQIKKSIRISGDGEFVHLRDWTVGALGNSNTSHGCINVGADYIYWFFDNFGAGDVVDVKNTGKNLDPRNGLGDWMLPWEEWQKGSALA